jgi:hypothetical protein
MALERRKWEWEWNFRGGKWLNWEWEFLGSIESGTSKGSSHGELEHQMDQSIESRNIKGIEHIKTLHQVKSSQSSLVTLTSFSLSSD